MTATLEHAHCLHTMSSAGGSAGADVDSPRPSPPSDRPARKRSAGDDADDGAARAHKASKACLNCRRQKMRCELDGDEPPCRRCRHSKVPCLFKVRANGVDAGDWYISDLGAGPDASIELFKASVLERLQAIESRLGMGEAPPRAAAFAPGQQRIAPRVAAEPTADRAPPDAADADGEPRDDSLPDLWTPLGRLAEHSGQLAHRGWASPVVETLWMAFAEHMPALHFSTHNVFRDRPTPVLLAAVLYAAAMQHPLAQYAQLAPFYRSAASRAIAQLAIPADDGAVDDRDVDALHDALGLIITGLMSEAWVTSTGIWIAIAYEKILAGANRSAGPRSVEWRSLYEGLRVVDIEHASLRLTCPMLPLTPPLACLEPPSPAAGAAPKSAYTHLVTIMHVGLSHFSGRHLPTLMETVLGRARAAPRSGPPPTRPYTADDARIIRGWAKELDSWLLRYHEPARMPQRGPSEANILLLQYQLHKLFVLSIYHPVRGIDVSKTPVSPERKELLAAARAALQLQRMGLSVWSNWDLVIITLAALVVLGGLSDGVARNEDRRLVQGHINALRTTHQPAPNLRHSLAAQLEARLLALAAPALAASDHSPASASLDYLSIFNADAEARVASTLSHVNPAWAPRPAAPAAYAPASAAQQTLAPALSAQDVGLAPVAPADGLGFGQLDPSLDWLDSSYDLGLDDAAGLGAWPPAFQRVLGGLVLGAEGI